MQQACLNFLDPGLLLFMFIGVFLGLAVGLLPAIGGLVPMAMVLPYLFLLTPLEGLPLIVTISAVGYQGGSMTAILLNIPGTEPNAATLIDGYPMSQKGEGARAIGAALLSSTLGGVLSILLALIMVPILMYIVMMITSAEMVFVVLLGISFISVLAERSMIKGIISGLLGLLISLIGYQAVTGIPRFTFGTMFLYDGIGLVPVIVGLFAIPEAIALASAGTTVVQTETKLAGMQQVLQGMRDVFQHWWLFLRSMLIGYVVGVIPGIGGAIGPFVSYGSAKASSKSPEKFGTGCVEGVIAPESANNAVLGGSLLTTLALGIPGSSGMAILLGAFVLQGLVPGPRMLTEHLDLSLTLLLVGAVTNIIAGAICFGLIPHISKIAKVPARILFPLILVIALTGTFLYRQEIGDVIIAVGFSIVGLIFRNFGYSRPALLLGFVLGTLFEQYLFISLGVGGLLFFMRPISLGLIAAIIGVVWVGILQFRKGKIT